MLQALPSVFAAGLCLALTSFAVPTIAQQTPPTLVQAMTICLDDFPDLSSAGQEALAAGFKYDGLRNSVETYTAHGEDLRAGFTPGMPACLFALDRLRNEAAISAASAVLAYHFGAEVVRMGGSADGYFLDAWVVPSRGISVGVRRTQWLGGDFHASLIEVRAYEPEQ